MISIKINIALLYIICYIQTCGSLVIPDDDGKFLIKNYKDD